MSSRYQMGRICASVVGACSFVAAITCGLFVFPAIGSAYMAPLVVAAFSAAFTCASCFAILALFDIADRICVSETPSTPADVIPPTPSGPIMPSENELAEKAEIDRAAEVARKIADYEARKNQ